MGSLKLLEFLLQGCLFEPGWKKGNNKSCCQNTLLQGRSGPRYKIVISSNWICSRVSSE
jgi:hypothetical protein